MSTYVEEDTSFSLALGASDYLEFEIMQSEKDDAEPDELANDKDFTLRMQLDDGAVISKSSAAVGSLLRFEFEPGDITTAGVYVATVWDDLAGMPLRPVRFTIPVLEVVGGPP